MEEARNEQRKAMVEKWKAKAAAAESERCKQAAGSTSQPSEVKTLTSQQEARRLMQLEKKNKLKIGSVLENLAKLCELATLLKRWDEVTCLKGLQGRIIEKVAPPAPSGTDRAKPKLDEAEPLSPMQEARRECFREKAIKFAPKNILEAGGALLSELREMELSKEVQQVQEILADLKGEESPEEADRRQARAEMGQRSPSGGVSSSPLASPASTAGRSSRAQRGGDMSMSEARADFRQRRQKEAMALGISLHNKSIAEVDNADTRKAYKTFDCDKNGYIDCSELQAALTQCTGTAVTMATTVKVPGGPEDLEGGHA